MSRKATIVSVERMMRAGCSPVTIKQNGHARSTAEPLATRWPAQVGPDRPLAHRFAPELRELLDQLSLLLRQLARGLHVDREKQVASATASQVRDALAPQADHGPRLRSRVEVDAL